MNARGKAVFQDRESKEGDECRSVCARKMPAAGGSPSGRNIRVALNNDSDCGCRCQWSWQGGDREGAEGRLGGRDKKRRERAAGGLNNRRVALVRQASSSSLSRMRTTGGDVVVFFGLLADAEAGGWEGAGSAVARAETDEVAVADEVEGLDNANDAGRPKIVASVDWPWREVRRQEPVSIRSRCAYLDGRAAERGRTSLA